MLRKLIAFAITSGLAKKAWEHYQASKAEAAAAAPGRAARKKKPAASRKATTVRPKAKAGS